MNAYWLISAPAWVVVFLTALARLADLGRADWAVLDHIRRIGLIGAAAAAAVMVVTPFAEDARYFAPASWRGMLIAISWATICIATRDAPPWWDWILGVHRHTDEWKRLGLWGRLRMEWRAIVASFTPRRYRRAPLAGPMGPLP